MTFERQNEKFCPQPSIGINRFLRPFVLLQGLLTFRDIITKAVYLQADARRLKVEDIMTKDVITCNPNSTVLDVVKTMKNRHLRRILVINAKNKFVGLITDFDLALFGWDSSSLAISGTNFHHKSFPKAS